MKKITASLVLLALLGATSCKKEEKKTSSTPDPDPPPPITKGSWTIDGTTYNATVADPRGSGVVFVGNSATSSISFLFQSLPKASGAYNVSDNIPPGPNEVILTTNDTSPYMDGVAESGTVNVTVSNGKVYLKCSGIKLFKLDALADTMGIGTLATDLHY